VRRDSNDIQPLGKVRFAHGLALGDRNKIRGAYPSG
jgi:hypothetical protein